MSKMQESNLALLMGSSPMTNILDHFIEHIGFDYTQKDVAKHAGLNRLTVKKYVKRLAELGVIKPNRKIAKATLYTLDTKNKTVKQLISLELAMIESTAPQKETLLEIKARA
ncbi:MAG: winged helix-turn-helix domain-containing protein [Candidatus Diapherotrites archaeon]|nr:winged helix-turn-helix domain-containing protein [Candidatus Diapherotrites archaeon]